MAYFNQDMKKQVVESLKEKFPDWKFGVSVRDYSTVVVKIKSGPFDLFENMKDVNSDNRDEIDPKEYMTLNHYYLGNYFSGEILKEIENILDCVNLRGSQDQNYRENDLSGDNTRVGFYVSLKLGAGYDKPYEHKPVELRLKKRKSM